MDHGQRREGKRPPKSLKNQNIHMHQRGVEPPAPIIFFWTSGSTDIFKFPSDVEDSKGVGKEGREARGISQPSCTRSKPAGNRRIHLPLCRSVTEVGKTGAQMKKIFPPNGPMHQQGIEPFLPRIWARPAIRSRKYTAYTCGVGKKNPEHQSMHQRGIEPHLPIIFFWTSGSTDIFEIVRVVKKGRMPRRKMESAPQSKKAGQSTVGEVFDRPPGMLHVRITTLTLLPVYLR
ncbi:hypothetical protein C8R46DRAFT_1032978 [Mycena filopes]|nr:hypothetical protein C8R46DRAFT_1032978 [Mycena filopes]